MGDCATSLEEDATAFSPANDERRRENEAGADRLDASMERFAASLHCDANAELERDRHVNNQRLKSRFEILFEKYERDFTDVGDEIDIATGEIVVDNGHLRNMQHEADPGIGESSQLLNEFTHTLEHEDACECDDPPEVSDVDDHGRQGDPSDDEETASITSLDIETPVGDTGAVRGAADVPIDPALLNTHATFPDPALPPKVTEEQRLASNVEAALSLPVPDLRLAVNLAISHQPVRPLDSTTSPGVEDHLQSLNSLRSCDVDKTHIQAFSLSLANQIARFLGDRSGIETGNKRRDPAWEYPELPAFKKAKTDNQRPSLPQLSNIVLSTAKATSRESMESVWAPLQHPRPRRLKKTAARIAPPIKSGNASRIDQSVTETSGGDHTSDDVVDLQKCANCSIAATTSWRTGPDGAGTLCNACGMYYYRYGLLKPFGEPTNDPESDDEDDGHCVIDSRRICAPTGRNARFTVEEDALIIKLKEVDKLSWERIARYFGGRSHYALQCRYSKNLLGDNAGRRALLAQGFTLDGMDETGPEMTFTQEQDNLLLHLRNDEKMEWKFVAKNFPGKDGYAVEARYNILMGIQLDPEERRKRKRANPKYSKAKAPRNHRRIFSPEEDELLIKLREIDKLPWEILAQEFTERTWLSLQKRYVRTLAHRLKVMKEGGDDPYMYLFLELDNISDDTFDDRPDRKRVQEMLRQRRQEDEILLRLRDQEGLTFEQIANQMQGRTVVSLINRYKYLKETSKVMDVPQDNSRAAAPSVNDHFAADGKRSVINLSMNSQVCVEAVAERFGGTRANDSQKHNTKPTSQLESRNEQNDAQGTPILACVDERSQSTTQSLGDHSTPRQAQVAPAPELITQPVASTHSTQIPPPMNGLSSHKGTDVSKTVGVQVPSASQPYSEAPAQLATTPNVVSCPSKRRVKYSIEEREIILKLHEEGRTWEEMAALLPGRTPRSIACFYSAHTGAVTKRNIGNVGQSTQAYQTRQDTILRQISERTASMADSADSTANGGGNSTNTLQSVLNRDNCTRSSQRSRDGNNGQHLNRSATVSTRGPQEVTDLDYNGAQIKREIDDDDVIFLSTQPIPPMLPSALSQSDSALGKPSEEASSAHAPDRPSNWSSSPTAAASPSPSDEKLPQALEPPHTVRVDSAVLTSTFEMQEQLPATASVPALSRARCTARSRSGKSRKQSSPEQPGQISAKPARQPRRRKPEAHAPLDCTCPSVASAKSADVPVPSMADSTAGESVQALPVSSRPKDSVTLPPSPDDNPPEQALGKPSFRLRTRQKKANEVEAEKAKL